MVASVVINGVMAWAFVITVLYCIGDLGAAMSGIYVYPIIEILYSSTGSKGGTTALMALIVFLGIIAMFSTLASVSRLTWAFARDNGLPFSDFFSRVSHSSRITYFGRLTVSSPGPPSPTHSSQLPHARHFGCHAPQPHQPRLNNRLLRHPLAEHSRPVHLVHYPDSLLHYGQASP